MVGSVEITRSGGVDKDMAGGVVYLDIIVNDRQTRLVSGTDEQIADVQLVALSEAVIGDGIQAVRLGLEEQERVRARATREGVVARAARQNVVATIAGDYVVAFLAEDPVVAVAARQSVVATDAAVVIA